MFKLPSSSFFFIFFIFVIGNMSICKIYILKFVVSLALPYVCYFGFLFQLIDCFLIADNNHGFIV